MTTGKIIKGLIVFLAFFVNVGCATGTNSNFLRRAALAHLAAQARNPDAYQVQPNNAQLRFIQAQQPVSSHCTRAFGGGVDCVSRPSGVDTSMYQ